MLFFFGKPVTIQHLFFEYSHTMFSGREVHMVLRINPPWSKTYFIKGIYFWKDRTFQPLLLIAIAIILLSLWITRKKVISNNCWSKSLLQVLFRRGATDPIPMKWGLIMGTYNNKTLLGFIWIYLALSQRGNRKWKLKMPVSMIVRSQLYWT